jgi:hypothetical protein
MQIISTIFYTLLFGFVSCTETTTITDEPEEISQYHINLNDVVNVIYTEAPPNNHVEYRLITHCVIYNYFLHLNKNPDSNWENYIASSKSLFQGLQNQKKIDKLTEEKADLLKQFAIQAIKDKPQEIKHFTMGNTSLATKLKKTNNFIIINDKTTHLFFKQKKESKEYINFINSLIFIH